MVASLILYGLGALIALKITTSIITSITHARKARQLGCEPIPWLPYPWWDLYGITLVRESLRYFKVQRFPQYLQLRNDRVEAAVGKGTRTFKFDMLGRKIITTQDPENVKAILATQFKDFHLPPTRKGTFDALMGTGIFTSDGKPWEHSRALLRPNFAREQVSNIDLEERHNQHLHKALAATKSSPQDNWTGFTDLSDYFFRLTIDTSTEFLFGESVNSQLAHLDANQSSSKVNFSNAFDNAQVFVARRSRLGQLWFLSRSKAFSDDCRTCHEFIDHYVRLALQQDTKPADPESGKQKYIFAHELVQSTRDPIEIRNQLMHILLAGRDTTASLLGWLFLLLARNPAEFAKLRQAITDDFGADPDNSSEISFSKLKSCAYLQASLSEALRLYPVVPANSRYSVVDTTLPRGGGPNGQSPVFIPKGTDVAYSVYCIHRDPTIWGADAAEFRPERFLKRKHGFEFLPFNGGPRVCLGQNFALTSAGYATVKLLQRYDKIEGMKGSESEVGAKEPSCNVSLTMRPGAGVWVRFKEAGKA